MTCPTLLPNAPRRVLACAGTGLLLSLAAGAWANDWPRFRGPDLDGISKEEGWTASWPASGPKVAWKAEVGTGFSSFAVAQGRVFTMGNTADTDSVFALDEKSGAVLWKHSYPAPIDPNLYEGGPNATPTVEGDTVFVFGRRGQVHALDATKGTVRWSKDISKETGAKPPEWGFSGSPLVVGGSVFLNAGGSGVALDKATGKVLWSSGVDPAGYSTPLPATVAGKPVLLLTSPKAFLAVDAATGKIQWSQPWTTAWGVNAAQPIARGDLVFVSSGYNYGAGLLDLSSGKPEVKWKHKDLRNQLNSSVLIDGHLYGVDGDSNNKRAPLRCVSFDTGDVKWTDDSVVFGSLMAAAGKLIILSSSGELVIADATPAGFKPLARAKVLDGRCWTVPVLANGRIYARNAKGSVVSLDVTGR